MKISCSRKQLVDLEAEQNASEAREGCCNPRSEQVRARITEIDASAARWPAQLLDQARDRREELPPPLAKCNRTCSTWRKLA